MKIIRLVAIVFAAVSLWCFTVSAQSQKPGRIIAGAAAGGGVDFLARIVAQSLSEQLKQNFVVENHSGAGGTLAASQVAKAAPDGYTLLACANAEITLSPHVMTNVAYDPFRELTPIVLLASAPTVVIVHPLVPAKSIGELITYARSKGSIGYGTPGYGSNAHINFELLRTRSDLPFFHVPYKGGGPAVLDLLGGQLELALLNTPPTISAIRSGNLRALAVLQTERSNLLPDVPTIGESIGVDSGNAATWFAIMGPSGLSPETLSRLESAILAIFTPEMHVRLTQAGLDVLALASGPFAARVRQESDAALSAIKQLGLKIN